MTTKIPHSPYTTLGIAASNSMVIFSKFSIRLGKRVPATNSPTGPQDPMIGIEPGGQEALAQKNRDRQTEHRADNQSEHRTVQRVPTIAGRMPN